MNDQDDRRIVRVLLRAFERVAPSSERDSSTHARAPHELGDAAAAILDGRFEVSGVTAMRVDLRGRDMFPFLRRTATDVTAWC